MRKKFSSMVVLFILLASCQPSSDLTSTSSSTPPVTGMPKTSATSLVKTSTPSNTPTATSTAVPVPITSSNIDSLRLTGYTDLGFEYPLVYQRAVYRLPSFVEPGRYIAKRSQNNWGAAKWSPDGEFLIVETSRGIDVLNSHDLTLVSEYDGFIPIDLLSNGDVAALSGNQVLFLNILDGGTSLKFEIDNPYVSMAVSPQGNLLAYATGSQTFNLVTLDSREEREFEIVRSFMPVSITDFAFSPDGTTLFVTTPVIYGEDVVTVFDLNSGTRMYEFPAAYPASHLPAFSDYAYWDKSDGLGSGYVAHPSSSGDAQVVTATFPASITARDAQMYYKSHAMSFLMDRDTLGVLYLGSSAAYGPPNGLLYIWDLTTMETRAIHNLGYPFPFEFAFSPDGSRFFTASFKGSFRIYDTTTGDWVASAQRYTFFWPASLNPDGSQVVIPYYDHFEILDLDGLTVLDNVVYPPFNYSWGPTVPYDSRVTFLPNDLISFWVGYAANSTTFMPSMKHTYTYDLLEHLILHRFDFGKESHSYFNCAFTDDGARQICQLADTEAIKFIDVAEVRTGTSLLRMRADNIDHYALSRDGATLAYCDGGAAVISLVEISSSRMRQINYPCQGMLFLSGDDRLLLADGQVVDLPTKDTVGQFEFPSPLAEFPLVFFQDAQNYVFIGSHFYDLQTGENIDTLPTSSVIYDMALTIDNLTLIILTDQGLEYWQAAPE